MSPHDYLAQLVGRWEGSARLWFDPATLAGQAPVTGEISPVGGGRWVRHDYATRIDGAEHSGSAMIGFHRDERAWEVAWVDTFHTGSAIMFSVGPLVDEADGAGPVSVLGSYGEPEGARWGWRTTFEAGAGAGLVVRHFNIPPGGEDGLAVEFDYAPAADGPR